MQEFQSFQLVAAAGNVVPVTPGRRYVMDISGDFGSGAITIISGAGGDVGTILFNALTDNACVEFVTPFDQLTFTIFSGSLGGVNVRIAPITVY